MDDRPRPLEALGDTVDGLYIVDHRQCIVRWNTGAERLLGYTAPEALQRKCYHVAPGYFPDGRPLCGAGCPIRSSVERGELPKGLECSVRAKNHRLVRLHISLIVIPSQPQPLVAHLLHRVADPGQTVDDRSPGRQVVTLGFTPREVQVLRLVAEGLSNSRIAGRLGVSRLTVRNHVQHILTKCGAHSRAEAVSFAFLSGVL